MYTFHQNRSSEMIKVHPTSHVLTGASTDSISCLRFSPKECPANLLGATAWDGSCSIWTVQNDSSGLIMSTPSWSTTHDAPILDMIFSADGRAFFGGCTNSAVMWDLQKNEKRVVAMHDLPISCLTFLSAAQVGGDLLITGSWDGKLRWWDLRTQNFVKEENLGEPIFAIDGQKTFPMMGVATGRTVHIYEMQGSNKVQEVKPPDMMKFNLRSITCSPQFDGISMGSSEGRMSYVPLSGETTKTCTFKAHMSTQMVSGQSIFFAHQTNFVVNHPNLPIVFTGGGDGQINAFNKDTKSNVKGFPIDCAALHEGLPISISAGDISGTGSILAFAHSYDWAMGKSGYRNQPTSIHLRALLPG